MGLTSKRRKAVIVQSALAQYRIPIFESLAKSLDLTVIHSGPTAEKTTFSQISLPARTFLGFNFQCGLRQQISELHPDAVIVMFDLWWPSFIPLMTKKDRCKIILWGHRYGRRKLANFLRDLLIKRADAVLLYGDEDVPQLLQNGLQPQKLFFAYNTIQVGNSQDCSKMQKDRFLFVGRLQKRKKLEKLLLAFSQATRQFTKEIRLEIIGEGDQYAYLAALSKQLNIDDRVDFSGAKYSEAGLKQSFSKAFAYVSPGAVGLSVLHSFAYGVPVVTFRKEYHGPEFYNLKHAENSLILEHDDELASALIQLQTQNEFREKISHNASIHYHTRRTPDVMIAGFLDAIGR